LLQRDSDETLARIREQLLLVDSEDRGRDLKDVQDILKRLEAVNEYMSGLEKRIKEHKAVSQELVTQYPDMTDTVREKADQLAALWSSANGRLAARRAVLTDSLKFHQFVHDCREFQVWLLDMDKKIKAVATPASAAEADACLSLHQERKAELTARQVLFARLKKSGEHLLAEKHEESARILAEIERTSEIQSNVEESWERTRVLLLQGNELHSFRQQNLRALAWLEEKEAFLNNEDLGDSLAGVENLVRKHQGFVTTLEKQAKVPFFIPFLCFILLSREWCSALNIFTLNVSDLYYPTVHVYGHTKLKTPGS
jgi:spectrin beta